MLTAVMQLRVSLYKVCISMCVDKYICFAYMVYFSKRVYFDYLALYLFESISLHMFEN